MTLHYTWKGRAWTCQIYHKLGLQFLSANFVKVSWQKVGDKESFYCFQQIYTGKMKPVDLGGRIQVRSKDKTLGPCQSGKRQLKRDHGQTQEWIQSRMNMFLSCYIIAHESVFLKRSLKAQMVDQLSVDPRLHHSTWHTVGMQLCVLVENGWIV